MYTVHVHLLIAMEIPVRYLSRKGINIERLKIDVMGSQKDMTKTLCPSTTVGQTYFAEYDQDLYSVPSTYSLAVVCTNFTNDQVCNLYLCVRHKSNDKN